MKKTCAKFNFSSLLICIFVFGVIGLTFIFYVNVLAGILFFIPTIFLLVILICKLYLKITGNEQKKQTTVITEYEWNITQLVHGRGNYHDKELDEVLGVEDELLKTTDEYGNVMYSSNPLNPWFYILGIILFTICTAACLHNIFSNKLEGYFNLILFIIISIFSIIADIWCIYGLIRVIKIKKSRKKNFKKSKLFSILYNGFLILFLANAIYFAYGLFTKNVNETIILILFGSLFIVGILAFIVQLILKIKIELKKD